MPATQSLEFVIIGLTRSGKRFRPSDWAERLAGVMSQFGGVPPVRYSPYCYPVVADGVKCVVVDARIREIQPLAYHFLVNFAADNELQTREGRQARRPADAPDGGPAQG
ncbi:MAG: DUF3579 domain-containing protein [Betaproteobacteria bacterium]|jgi:thioester reductase-like protein|nr:DUF3579 domain-containing protein [Betaproteobacteria bacterium]